MYPVSTSLAFEQWAVAFSSAELAPSKSHTQWPTRCHQLDNDGEQIEEEGDYYNFDDGGGEINATQFISDKSWSFVQSLSHEAEVFSEK